ncbi:MAG TPA: ABC transporter ATP-binding protein [Marmoricola sp.]|nr:ABC transporter ATP-binding protein [Marmoricola sp.]
MTDAAVLINGRPILRDIDLTVRAGEVVAILGANGSGKSTLVKAAVGLHRLTRGEVRLFGTPLGEFRDWSRLGYVPQRSPIAQGVPSSVWEVVASGRISHRRPFLPMRRVDRVAVEEALDAVGMADRARQPVATLSGGQQQRVLVARTLASEPDLLLLDEPNAGVDLLSQDAIAETLATRSRAGATVVVVLHELGPFAEMIQRTVMVREGRIAYDGDPAGIAALLADHGHHHPPSSRGPVPDVQAPLEGGR